MNAEKPTKTIKKDLISDVDQFLQNFKNTHKPTASELAEMAKSERVMKMRDAVELK